MEIFDALEAILTVVSEFLYDKAFNKSIKLIKRIPYLLIYIAVLIIIIIGLVYLAINLINNKNILFGFSLLIIAILCIFILLFSILKRSI